MTVLKRLTNIILPPVLKMVIRKALHQVGPEVHAFIQSGLRSPLCLAGQLSVTGPSLASIDVSLDDTHCSATPQLPSMSSPSSAKSRRDALKLLELTAAQARVLCVVSGVLLGKDKALLSPMDWVRYVSTWSRGSPELWPLVQAIWHRAVRQYCEASASIISTGRGEDATEVPHFFRLSKRLVHVAAHPIQILVAVEQCRVQILMDSVVDVVASFNSRKLMEAKLAMQQQTPMPLSSSSSRGGSMNESRRQVSVELAQLQEWLRETKEAIEKTKEYFKQLSFKIGLQLLGGDGAPGFLEIRDVTMVGAFDVLTILRKGTVDANPFSFSYRSESSGCLVVEAFLDEKQRGGQSSSSSAEAALSSSSRDQGATGNDSFTSAAATAGVVEGTLSTGKGGAIAQLQFKDVAIMAVLEPGAYSKLADGQVLLTAGLGGGCDGFGGSDGSSAPGSREGSDGDGKATEASSPFHSFHLKSNHLQWHSSISTVQAQGCCANIVRLCTRPPNSTHVAGNKNEQMVDDRRPPLVKQILSHLDNPSLLLTCHLMTTIEIEDDGLVWSLSQIASGSQQPLQFCHELTLTSILQDCGQFVTEGVEN